MSEDGKTPKKGAKAAPKQDWLGDQLRELYSSYEDEELPNDLRSLLDKLDDSENGGSDGGKTAQ